MEKKLVKAGTTGPCATEENSHRFIGDTPVEVPMTAYYCRRLMQGDLVEVQPPAAPKAKEK